MNDAIRFWKAVNLDFSKVFTRVEAPNSEMRCTMRQDHGIEGALDWTILPQVEDAIATGKKAVIDLLRHEIGQRTVSFEYRIIRPLDFLGRRA